MDATARIKEIDALLEIIEKKSAEYSADFHKADEENRNSMAKVLPELSLLELRKALKEMNFRDELRSFELDFNGYSSFSISLTAEKNIKRYAVSMISDNNPTPEEFTKTVNYYSDVAKLLQFINTEESKNLLVETFLTFTYPKWEDYQTGFNEYQLKEEKNALEKQLAIEALNFKVGGTCQLLIEGHRRREYWILIKVTSRTAKRFQYQEFSNGVFQTYEQSATIDYCKLKPLTEEQKFEVQFSHTCPDISL